LLLYAMINHVVKCLMLRYGIWAGVFTSGLLCVFKMQKFDGEMGEEGSSIYRPSVDKMWTASFCTFRS